MLLARFLLFLRLIFKKQLSVLTSNGYGSNSGLGQTSNYRETFQEAPFLPKPPLAQEWEGREPLL